MPRSALIAATALLLAGTGAAAAQTGPGVAIGAVHQTWNRVTVDYGVGDPATVELRVIAPDGRTEVADRGRALQGTLVWDRKIGYKHVPVGTYQLVVVATNDSGTSRATRRVRLGLIYFSGRPDVNAHRAVMRYTLAEAARVKLYVKVPGRPFVFAEKRSGIRGHNHMTWNLKLHGRRVPAGRLVMQLRATT